MDGLQWVWVISYISTNIAQDLFEKSKNCFPRKFSKNQVLG